MNVFGWIFLAASWSIIIVMLVYCSCRILFSRKT